jgi:hypothetical protein
MYTFATIFLCIIVFCIGTAVGSLIENVLNKRSKELPQLLPVKNKHANEGDVEVFSAWRNGNNQVWIEMDGKRVGDKDALGPDQYQRLLNLVLDLRPWLERGQPLVQGAGEAAPAVQPVVPEAETTARLVQPKMKKNPPTAKVETPAPAFESIIEQIDKVLQSKLAASAFKERGIRLTEAPGGIVIIQDGSNRYQGIEAVPDPQLKALIQQAVSDWEKNAR